MARAVMNLFAILTHIDGRIGRKSYWIGSLIIIGAVLAAAIAIVAIAGEAVFDGPDGGSSALGHGLGWVLLLASVPVSVKRLHDLNRSGHYLWPMFILDALLTAGDVTGWTGTPTEPNAIGWVLIAVYGIYSLVLLIHLGFYRGTAGRNDFGPDPLAPAEIPATVSF
jgi:uncharacterized membrane protein YhaH (DUF805 family)